MQQITGNNVLEPIRQVAVEHAISTKMEVVLPIFLFWKLQITHKKLKQLSTIPTSLKFWLYINLEEMSWIFWV